MKTRALIVFLVCSLLGLEISYAQQTGDVDTTFRISRNGTLTGVGTIYQVLVQPDQKVLALGNFTGIGSYQSPYLLRFHTDGRVDTSFRSPFWVGQFRFISGDVYFRLSPQIKLLKENRIFVTGRFDSVGLSPIKGITILDSAGRTDTSFHPYRTLLNGTYPVEMQFSSCYIDSGSIFTSFKSAGYLNILTRLKMNGDWDTTFHPAYSSLHPGNSYQFWKLSPLTGNKLLIHGYNGCGVCPSTEFYSYGFIFQLDSLFPGPWPVQLEVEGSAISFNWLKEKSGKLYTSVDQTGIFPFRGFVRVDIANDTACRFPLILPSSTGELMDYDEMLIHNYYSIYKIINIDSSAISQPIGSANGNVFSITRNASNQAYLAGDFTQYNGQNYPKLVRIHNFKTVTGVSPTLKSSSFSLSPNPSSSGQCLLETGSQDKPIVSITDHLGRNVPFTASRQSANSFQLKLDNPHSSTGIYLVRLASNQEVKTLKWLVSGE